MVSAVLVCRLGPAAVSTTTLAAASALASPTVRVDSELDALLERMTAVQAPHTEAAFELLAVCSEAGVALLRSCATGQVAFVRSPTTSEAANVVSGFALERNADAFERADERRRQMRASADSAIVGLGDWPLAQSDESAALHVSVDALGATLVQCAAGSVAFVRLLVDEAARTLRATSRCDVPGAAFVRFGSARGTALLRDVSDSVLLYLLPSCTSTTLLHRVVLYDGTAAAERLCTLNGWPLEALHEQALELGLRHRQLDVFTPTLRAMSAEQQERVAVPLALKYLADTGRTRADPEFALRLVSETMQVLSVRINALLAAGDTLGSDRVAALAAALRTLRKAQREALQIAADLSRVGSTAAAGAASAAPVLGGDGTRADGARAAAIAAAMRLLDGTPVAAQTAADSDSTSFRVAMARQRQPGRSAWPAVVADVCRAAFDAFVAGDDARAVSLLNRLGVDVPEHAAALAMYVPHAGLRDRLLALAGRVAWTSDERAALAWLAEVHALGQTAQVVDSEFAGLYSALAGQRRAIRAPGAAPRHGAVQSDARSLGGRVGLSAAWLAYESTASDRGRVLLDAGVLASPLISALSRVEFARDRLRLDELASLLGQAMAGDALLETAASLDLVSWSAGERHDAAGAALRLLPVVQQFASAALVAAHRQLFVPRAMAGDALDAAMRLLAQAGALFRRDGVDLGPRRSEFHAHVLSTLLSSGSSAGALLYAAAHELHDAAAFDFADRALADHWRFVSATARIVDDSSALGDFAVANARLLSSECDVAPLVAALLQRRSLLASLAVADLATAASESEEVLSVLQTSLAAFPTLALAWRTATAAPLPPTLTSARGDLTFASLVPALARSPHVRAHVDAPDVAMSLGAGLAAGALSRTLRSRLRATYESTDGERRASAALARYAAFRALSDDVVVGAALAFTDWLCGADAAHLLRVDVVAARRIVEWRDRSDSEQDPRRVAHLFLQFGGPLAPSDDLGDLSKPTSPVFRALRLLEDATLALTLSPAAVAARGSGAQSLWSLVTSFCHVHALPLSTGHLCELAQANDWVGLLYEAQTQHFPLWQVRDIVRRHVTSHAVRAHILSALREPTRVDAGDATIASEHASGDNHNDDGDGDDDDASEDDDNDHRLINARSASTRDALEGDHVVFDAVLAALDADGNKGESLLAQALQTSSTTLAVLASCFPDDVRVLDCIVVFLFAAQSKILAAQLDRIEIPSSVAQLEQCVTALLCADDSGAGADAVHDALALFRPQCPLQRYVQFHRAMRVARLDVAQPALAAFAGALAAPALSEVSDSAAALDQLCEWHVRAARSAALALLASLGSDGERADALQLLAGSGLAPVFATLRDAVAIVRECRVAVPWSEVSSAAPDVAVKRVASARELPAARKLARCFGLHALADRIACREADRLLRSLQTKRAALSCIVVSNAACVESSLPATPVRAGSAVQQLMPFMSISKAESHLLSPSTAQVFSPRAPTQGSGVELLDSAVATVGGGVAWQWQRCSQLLLACECAASVAGDWFLEKVTPHTSRSEQLWLLREALAWFKGERGDSNRQAAQKPRQLVSQLEIRVMFLADDLSGDAAAADSIEQQQQQHVSLAGSTRAPRALSAVVGRLLQRGDVSQARALCRQYQCESVDVQLVELARRYALGTPAAIVAASFPPAAQALVDAHNGRAALLGAMPLDAPSSLSSGSGGGGGGSGAAARASDETCTVVDPSVDAQRSIVITILGQGCSSPGARMACAQARARCDVARALNSPSEAIAARDPLDVLSVLVRGGRAHLALAEAWVACHSLDAERTAQLLARAFVGAQRQFHPRAPSRAAAASPEPVAAAPAAALDDSVTSPRKPAGGKMASVRRALFGRRSADSESGGAAKGAAALPAPELAGADDVGARARDASAVEDAAREPRHRAALDAEVDVRGAGIERNWTTEEFAMFARLCTDPAILGRLLEAELSRFSEPNAEVDSSDVGDDAAQAATQAALAAQVGGADRQLSYACESELLVAAYRCFDIAGDAEAAASLLARMRERAPLFARAGEHRLLVRLYTGARAYAQMRWLLDLLVRFDRFELVLGKRVAVEADRERLCASLDSYLKQQLGRVRGASEIAAIERLQHMLYLRFSMWRSIGRALEARAEALISDVCDSVTPVASSSLTSSSGGGDDDASEQRRRARRSGASEPANDIVLGVFGASNEQRLLGAMRTLLDAADHFARANFPGSARRCVARVVLIGAQLREPSTRLLGLSIADARRLMMHHGAFDATLAVARGYALDDSASWVRTTYQQVVVRGNMPFVSRMILRGMRPRVLAGDVVAMYRSELSVGQAAGGSSGKAKEATTAIASASRRGNMQAFLRAALDDAVALHDFCELLGFTEMKEYVSQSRALQFLRPPGGATPQQHEQQQQQPPALQESD
jgi:hypothetical protein